jgi:beta-glucosidase
MVEQNKPLYLDPAKPLDTRVDDLISRMTLEEKISQMTNDAAKIEHLYVPKYNWWNECLHGVANIGIATVFPQAIGLAATWNIELMDEVSSVISDEGRAKHHDAIRRNRRRIFMGLTFWSPNVNLFRDPRWGRGQETYGEDPYLSSRMGVSFVKGLQGDNPKYLKVVATPKHYVVHSGPEPERHSIDIKVSKKDLYESYLPAFKACVQEGKAASIMPAYNRVNSKPCGASKELLEEILRGELGFDGYVVSDCGALTDIFQHHKVVETPEEASAMAINAGMDLFCIGIMSTRKKKVVWRWIKGAVERGLLTEDKINESLKRLFTARFRLGMFDPPELVPYAQIPIEKNDCEDHRALALRAARESIVLLKNESNILPLNNGFKSIAVIGPVADDLEVLLGNYNGTPSRHTTFLQGIKDKVQPETEIYYAKGCALTDISKDGFDEAIEVVKKADIAIVVLGISHLYESEEMMAIESEANGDRVHLDLPGVQEDLLKKIYDTGTPIILVLTSGSALSVNFAKENIPAVIQAWYPGEEGGTAIADVIFGDYNPAGRLPVTFYKSVDQLPDFLDYNMEGRTYRYFKGEPLYSFGYGLSYTKFQYSNLQLSPKKVKTDENISVTIDVENIGERTGDEVVQVYVNNKTASIRVPIRELQGFRRISLNKGEKKNVSFNLTPSQFSIVNEHGKRLVEPGNFGISVGGCQPGYSEDGKNMVEGEFEVVGEIRQL